MSEHEVENKTIIVARRTRESKRCSYFFKRGVSEIHRICPGRKNSEELILHTGAGKVTVADFDSDATISREIQLVSSA
jgi:hypothetical protein